MNRKPQIAVVLILTLLLSAGLAPASIARMPAAAPVGLVQVRWDKPADLVPLDELGITVYARLTDAQGSYLLVGAGTADVAALAARGLAVRTLDADVTGASYYLASPAPNRRAPDWSQYGQVLLDDGQRVLLSLSPGTESDALAALTAAGARGRRVTFDPKPLYPRDTVQAWPQVIVPDPVVQSMIAQVSSAGVLQYTRELAGELPVWVDGESYTIPSRYTYSGTPIQKAGRYVGQKMAALGLDVEYHVWDVATNPNVIGELPGLTNPDDIYIIGGHLDAVQNTPGADDNASGSVAAMLAADIFSQYQWGCTLRFAFWTGEEQWMLGSEAYAARSDSLNENILGYLNLDMIAYNSPGSPPELDLYYRPDMPTTLQLAQLFADAIDAYDLNLIPDVRVDSGGGSDQEPFWDHGFTSILAIEDEEDFNPQYHLPGDTPANNDLAYYTDYVKASLATFAHQTGCLVSTGIGALDGHVTDAGSSAPIAGAAISMLGQGGAALDTTTDSSGYYTQTLLADTYTVTAEAYGYLPAVITGVAVVTDTVTTLDIPLQPSPTYLVSGTVTQAGSGVPLLAQITLDGSPATATTDPATGYYELALPAGSYTMHVRADGHRSQERAIEVLGDQTQSFVLEPLPCILLVDDDNNLPDVQSYYTAALTALGYGYDVYVTGGWTGPSLDEMQGYDILIWFSGDAYGGTAGPNSTDEAALAAYLDGGGALFLSAQDYLYDRGLNSFGQTYLGIASYTSDGGNASSKYGVPGDPVGGGLGPYPLLYPNGFSDYGDVVNAGAGASVAFRSAASGGNNLDVDKAGPNWKTVFFGTSWVPIQYSNPANGQAVLQRILDWFGGCDCPLPENVTFAWTPPQPEVGETVTFTGTADSDLALGYQWDMGDGGQAQGPVVEHVYTAVGDYAVVMTATNYCGSVAVTHSVPVTVSLCDPATNAAFTWQPLSPLAGETVLLTGSADGDEPLAFTWALGDGTTGNGITLTHTYTEPGGYTVVMTAANSCGLDEATDTLVVVGPPCTPVDVLGVTVTPGECSAVLSAELTGTPPFSYTWDLGSLGLFTTPVVTATVDAAGTYPYTLTVANCASEPAVVTGTFTVDCTTPPLWRIYLPLALRP